MPAHHRLRADKVQARPPAGVQSAHQQSEPAVAVPERGLPDLPPQDNELLAQGEVVEDQVAAGPERGAEYDKQGGEGAGTARAAASQGKSWLLLSIPEFASACHLGEGAVRAGKNFELSMSGGRTKTRLSCCAAAGGPNAAVASGAILVPAADALIDVTTDGAGVITISSSWPTSLPSPAKLYVQFIIQNAGGNLLSNAVEMRALTSSEVTTWEAISSEVAAAFPKYSSSRSLTTQEAAALAADDRVDDIVTTLALYESSTLLPDLNGAQVDTYTQPEGWPTGSETQFLVPLIETGSSPPVMRGAIFIVSLSEPNGLAYALVAGDDPQDLHFTMYAPDGSTSLGYGVKISFSGDHENIGEEILGGGSFGAGDGDGPTIEEILEWLNSPDSPAKDMPWWFDILTGIACGDALLGTHNPLSISLCIHAIGAYAINCFYDGTPSA